MQPLLICNLLFSMVLLSSAGAELPHDTPDGFVERAVAVVVKDRKVEISVQIGINEKTMRDLFSNWTVEGEFESESQVTERFCEEIQERLLDHYSLQLDGIDLAISVASVEPFAEHHKTAVMKLVAEIPEEIDKAKLTFQDSSFEDFEGAVRLAIKGRGSTLVTRASVAPIVIRADRIELGPLSLEERRAACQLEAQLKLISR